MANKCANCKEKTASKTKCYECNQPICNDCKKKQKLWKAKLKNRKTPVTLCLKCRDTYREEIDIEDMWNVK